MVPEGKTVPAPPLRVALRLNVSSKIWPVFTVTANSLRLTTSAEARFGKAAATAANDRNDNDWNDRWRIFASLSTCLLWFRSPDPRKACPQILHGRGSSANICHNLIVAQLAAAVHGLNRPSSAAGNRRKNQVAAAMPSDTHSAAMCARLLAFRLFRPLSTCLCAVDWESPFRPQSRRRKSLGRPAAPPRFRACSCRPAQRSRRPARGSGCGSADIR